MPAPSLRVDVDGQSYLLEPSERVVIGRDPSCRLHLPNPLVSSRHLQLHHDGSMWRATDLGSTNGTWINGQRVAEVPPGPSRAPLEERIGDGSFVNGVISGSTEAATPTV